MYTNFNVFYLFYVLANIFKAALHWIYSVGEYLPADRVHPDTFKNSNRPFSIPKGHLIAIERHNRVKSDDVEEKNRLNFVQKYEKKMARLAELGIEYKLESLVGTMYLRKVIHISNLCWL